ncbi:P-loop containing nucleoside triphosphate hydrolase protein [Chytridium lagenaria]|nr:P-loop containing nucleoside triphosphate hydrolase protein [Chytridium lagenaria]
MDFVLTNIRNICILAHVDHGKTTLSDSLLASNGIISSKLAGKVRYLDSREDEQERGITMMKTQEEQEYLINLIDSPGHVDFLRYIVSTASRLCDGALVLVDAVEGVCTQTHAVLRQAFTENVRPVLVLNKMDRLITELKMTPLEAYQHLNNILGQVNAIIGTFHTENLIADDARQYEEAKAQREAHKDDGAETAEWVLEDRDDSHLYFSPEAGNVIFSSAIDGWAFRIDQFAAIYAAKMKVKESILKKALWGDFYFDPKTKRAIGSQGLKGRNLKPFFVQFILDNIWAVYDSVYEDRTKLEKIITTLNVKVLPRDLKSKDGKALLALIMSQWLPISSTILVTVTSTTIAYISKVFSDKARGEDVGPEGEGSAEVISTYDIQDGNDTAGYVNDETLVGFARIYSGTIKVGQKIFVLGPKYNPSKPTEHCSEIVVQRLFLLMGRELEDLDEVPAGNVFGISGIDLHVLKTATLSTTQLCPSFGKLTGEAPILRVALEPENPGQMAKLVHGLHLLNQADPCVEVFLQETGEHVIVTAGELHLERCIKDLRERFAKIEISVSQPIVPFRETLSYQPAIQSPSESVKQTKDNIKESVSDEEDRGTSYLKEDGESGEKSEEKTTYPVGTVVVSTSNQLATIRVRAVPLPRNVISVLDSHAASLKQLMESGDVKKKMRAKLGEVAKVVDDPALHRLITDLNEAFKHASQDSDLIDKEVFSGVTERIWAFGPRDVGANIFVNMLQDETKEGSDEVDDEQDDELQSGMQTPRSNATEDETLQNFSTQKILRSVENAMRTGFQLATSAGPLSFSGLVIATMRDACKQAYLQWSPRLSLAMYSCDLQAPAEVLGKVYAVLAKRKGRILSEELREGTPIGFSDDIRKRTAGAASPQLIFHGYVELEDLGEKADRDNLAKKYMEGVRKRKGMFVEKKIVEHAEKQRTLKVK